MIIYAFFQILPKKLSINIFQKIIILKKNQQVEKKGKQKVRIQ